MTARMVPTSSTYRSRFAVCESELLRVGMRRALQAVLREREKATESLEAGEKQLEELRASLALAREGRERDRRRLEQETKQVETMRDELDASEARRKAQEEDISLTRTQVSFDGC